MLQSNPLKQPCACGSGRKARYCCERNQANEQKNDILRLRTVTARKKLTKELVKLLQESDIEIHVENAWAFFSGDDPDHPPPAMMPIFMPWFIHRWGARRQDIDLVEPRPSHSLASLYRKRHGSSLDAIERECLSQALQSPMSFFKAVDVVPGKEVTVIDLLRNDDDKTIVLNDVSLSNCLVAGGIFMGLIFNVHGVATAEGAAPYLISPGFTQEILDLAEEIEGEFGNLSDQSLIESEMNIFDTYWYIQERSMQERVVTNTSGEDINLQSLYFDCTDQMLAIQSLVPLTRRPEVIKEILESLKSPTIEDEFVFNWSSSKPSPKLLGPVVYGTITVTKDTIKVDVNSDARANRIKREISKRLGDAAKFRTSKPMTLEEKMSSTTNSQTFSEMPEDIQKSIRAMASERKKKWFNSPIPLLHGKSPREAAKTADGRKLLEILIETYGFNPKGTPKNDLTDLFNPTEEEIRKELNL